jgi:hypothetical protein
MHTSSIRAKIGTDHKPQGMPTFFATVRQTWTLLDDLLGMKVYSWIPYVVWT